MLNPDKNKLEEEIYDNIENDSELDNIIDKEDEIEEYIRLLQIVQSDLDEFYVYQMEDGSIRIETLWICELELEFENIKELEYNYYYPNIYAEFHIVINKKSIESIEYIDWFSA